MLQEISTKEHQIKKLLPIISGFYKEKYLIQAQYKIELNIEIFQILNWIIQVNYDKIT